VGKKIIWILFVLCIISIPLAIILDWNWYYGLLISLFILGWQGTVSHQKFKDSRESVSLAAQLKALGLDTLVFEPTTEQRKTIFSSTLTKGVVEIKNSIISYAFVSVNIGPDAGDADWDFSHFLVKFAFPLPPKSYKCTSWKGQWNGDKLLAITLNNVMNLNEVLLTLNKSNKSPAGRAMIKILPRPKYGYYEIITSYLSEDEKRLVDRNLFEAVLTIAKYLKNGI
jgi:hypothetical protein